MIKIKYHVNNPEGIHARPAELLVSKLSKLKCNVIIEKDEKAVNGKKIFALMSLSIKQNDTIFIIFEGEEEGAEAEKAEKILKYFQISKQ